MHKEWLHFKAALLFRDRAKTLVLKIAADLAQQEPSFVSCKSFKELELVFDVDNPDDVEIERLKPSLTAVVTQRGMNWELWLDLVAYRKYANDSLCHNFEATIEEADKELVLHELSRHPVQLPTGSRPLNDLYRYLNTCKL